VLILDADERVTPALEAEIADVLADPRRRAGYWLRRRSFFLGREIRGCGWQWDKVLRLFDRRHGRYETRRVHEEVRLTGQSGKLREPLLHPSYRDLGSWLAKVDRYAAWGAAEARAQGRRGGLLQILLHPPARFLKQYVLQAGFRDGIPGLVLCAVSAFGVFLKYVRLRELGRDGS
jgi:hypothetical protein